MSVRAEQSESPKLNILALPSHTSILFALIATVVVGAAFATMLPGSRLWWPPIVLGLTLLPLRDFLHRPDLQMKRNELKEHRDESSRVTEQELESLAGLANRCDASLAPDAQTQSEKRISPDSLPRVVTTAQPQPLESFGTFHRHYIAMRDVVAVELSAGLKLPPGRDRDRHRMMLAHEFAHFLNRDVWLVWLSFSMLKMLMLVMALNLWIGLVLSTFIIEVGPEVLSPGFWTAVSERFSDAMPGIPVIDLSPVPAFLTQQNPTLAAQLADPAQRWANWQGFLLYLVGAQWPFVLAAVVLIVVYWPRLLRVREMYADVRAATLVGDSSLIPEAINLAAWYSAPWVEPVESLRQRLRGLLSRVSDRVPWHQRAAASLGGLSGEREKCLEDPLTAFGSWPRIAIAAGLATLLLDLALRSSLAANHVSEPGAHLPFLIVYLTFSVWLLPLVCSGDLSSGRRAMGAVTRLVLLFTAIKLTPHILDAVVGLFMLHTAPSGLGEIIDLWAYSMAGATGGSLPPLLGVEVSWDLFMSLHVVRPIAYYSLLMPPILVGTLWLDARLKQRALTWYRSGMRVKRAFWLVTGILALGLTFVIIPVLNHIIFPEIYSAWSPAALIGMAFALLALGVGAAAFLRRDRALAHLCPACSSAVPGDFQLGLRCADCGAELHPWLVARYKVKAPVE